MIELDDLRGFVEVVESGGFNRAAKRLGISKSIVSRRIARLEADLRLLSHALADYVRGQLGRRTGLAT